MMTLRLYLCALGLATATAADSIVDQTLLDRAIAFAKASNADLLPRLEGAEPDADALYLAASGLNATSSKEAMDLWRALADGPAGHEPSAYALAEIYSDVNGGMRNHRAALKYYGIAMGKDDDHDDANTSEMHRTAQLHAGRLLDRMHFVPRAMAMFRRCHRGQEDELGRACAEAHETLCDQVDRDQQIPGGIMGHVEVFEAASLDFFPRKGTEERRMWDDAVAHLKDYGAKLREGVDDGHLEHFRAGQATLLAARDDMDLLMYKYARGRGMSELQEHMLQWILDTIHVLAKTHDHSPHDEL